MSQLILPKHICHNQKGELSLDLDHIDSKFYIQYNDIKMFFPKTATVREVQRNYKKIFEEVKKTKQPIYIMKNNKPDVAIVDVKKLEEIGEVAAKATDWEKLWKDLRRIRSFKGKGEGNLSAFIAQDRLMRR